MNKDCYQKAVRLLTKKEYSRPKLEEKLIASGYSSEDSKLAVDKLHSLGLIKEDWYIETKIKNMMRKGYSKMHIQQRLSYESLEVELETINTVFTQYNQDESSTIQNLLDKKAQRFQSNWDEIDHEEQLKIKAKLIRAITAKGYSLNDGISAVDSYFHSK